MRHIKIISAFW